MDVKYENNKDHEMVKLDGKILFHPFTMHYIQENISECEGVFVILIN